MKIKYTESQLAHKKVLREKRKRKKNVQHNPVKDKQYTVILVSPMQCLDGVNEVLKTTTGKITKFGDTHIIIDRIDEKECKKLATDIYNCRVTTEKGRTFKVIFASRKYKDVTPTEKKEPKKIKSTKIVKLPVYVKKPNIIVKSLADLLERRILQKAA